MQQKNYYKLNLLSRYSTHNIIIDNVGLNKTVLDVGCNDGYIGQHCDKSNIFYGLDYSENSINKTKNIYKDAVVFDLNLLQKLPWGNTRFDVIIFADVLEHILYPEKVLSFFVENYLKDGGCVILSVPNIANWQVRLKLLLGRFNYTDSGIMDRTHLHLYTFKTATDLILGSNLTIKNKIGGASVFGPVLAVFPFLKSLLATNIIIKSAK
jgi:2-polyprenyl-3-methyl-5-hydroxy-6-metoxy-1,4-benzoquinol methylase